MSIRLISISHKTAPLEVRELFAFTKEKQAELEKILIDEGGAAESVIIATCNRTEIYTYFDKNQDKKKNVFTRLQELILRESGAAAVKEDVSDYLRFYQDRKVVNHLFSVTAGLDSRPGKACVCAGTGGGQQRQIPEHPVPLCRDLFQED